MFAVDPSLKMKVGAIGRGAFLKADGSLNKRLVYATLHNAHADTEIAKTLADGAGSNGGVCHYVQAIGQDLSGAGQGAPNTRTARVQSWESAAAAAVAKRVDYTALACIPALRVSMSPAELADTDLVLVTSLTTAQKQLALCMPLAAVIPPKPRAYFARLAADATGEQVQGFLSSTFEDLAKKFDCEALREAIPLVVTEELSAHMTESALNSIGTCRGAVTTAYLWSKKEDMPFCCLTPAFRSELQGFGLPVPDVSTAAPIQHAERRPVPPASPEPSPPTTLLAKLEFNATLARLSDVKEPYTAEEASTLVAEMDRAIMAANGAARPRCPLPLC
jgi:hypothetical protein